MRALRRAGAIIALLSLSGCGGTWDAYRARTTLVGMPEPDLIACMGVPTENATMGPADVVRQWDYSASVDALDITLPMGASAKFGRSGVCKTSIWLHGGYVRLVDYPSGSVSPIDPESICGKLIAACYRRPPQYPLPAGWKSSQVTINK